MMKIGLALGSGSARGWAHIGVIERLIDLGVKIDIIAGCSVGSYVGAAYANNKLEELKYWVSHFTEWQVAGLMGVGFNRGGLLCGDKVLKQLHQQFKVSTFDQLDKTLGVVATDLFNGKEIWISEGDVIEAVRASCATPALFPAVWHKTLQRWLVDGAVVNPVPVSLCHHLGADFVIAVNLNSDYRPQLQEANVNAHRQNQQNQQNLQKTNAFFAKSKSLLDQWINNGNSNNNNSNNNSNEKKPSQPSMLGAFTGALSIMQDRVTRSKLVGEPPDILIEPQLEDFSMLEYHRATELIEEGWASVDRLTQQISYQINRITPTDI